MEETVFLLELIFAIFWKSRSRSISWVQTKQNENVRQINQCHSITLGNNQGTSWCMIHRVMYSIFLLQTSIFVHNFYFGEWFFFRKKKITVILFCGNLFLRIAKKTQQKLESQKIQCHTVTGGMWELAPMQDAPMWKVTLRDISRYCIPGGMHELAPICKTPLYVR